MSRLLGCKFRAFPRPLDFQLHGIGADFRGLRHPSAVNVPLDGAGQGADQLGGFLQIAHLLVVVPQVILPQNGGKLIFHPIGGFLQ